MATKKTKTTIALAAIVLLSLLVPVWERHAMHNDLPVGDDAYYHMRLAREIQETEDYSRDELIWSGRKRHATPYHMALSVLMFFFDEKKSTLAFSVSLGMLTIAAFYSLLRELELPSLTIFAMLGTYSLSPAFIRMFTTANPHSMYFFLLILTLKLALRGNYFAFLSATLASFFGTYETAFLLLSLIAMQKISRERSSIMPGLIVAIVLIEAVNLSVGTHTFSIAKKVTAGESFNYLGGLISSLGADPGVSIFAIMLSIIGIFYLKRKKKMFWLYVPYILLFAAYPLVPDFAIQSIGIISSALAGYAIVRLGQRDWDIKELKGISIFLLVCGIVFTAISYEKRISEMQPDASTESSLAWLKNNSDSKDTVFSTPDMGHYIQYFAERKTVTDSRNDFDNRSIIVNDTKALLHTKSARKAREIIDRYGIRYIYASRRAREEGLLFVLRNNETFKNIYRGDDKEIWKIID